MRLPMLSTLCLLVLTLFIAGCSDDGGAPPPSGSTVTLTIINSLTMQPYSLPWVAFQDGAAGSWRRVSPTSPGVFACAVTDPAGAYGFAIPPLYSSDDTIYLLQATLADATALTFPLYLPLAEGFSRLLPDGPDGRRGAPARIAPGPNHWSMQGMVTGIPHGFDHLGMACPSMSSSLYVWDATPFPYSFIFPAGWPTDCAVILLDYSAPYDTGLLYLRRGLNNTAGATITEDIDFSAPYGGAKHTCEVTERTTVSVDGASYFNVSWMTAGGANLPLRSGAGPSLEYGVIPAAAVTAGDRYYLFAGGEQSGMYTLAWSHAPFTSCELPDPFTCGLTGRTYTGLDHEGASMYDLHIGNQAEDVEWNAFVTPAWLAAGGSDDYTFPDLSGLEGWQSAWDFETVTYVYAVENEFDGPFTHYFKYWLPRYVQEPFADGAYLRAAAWQPEPAPAFKRPGYFKTPDESGLGARPGLQKAGLF
jgi:hypothetical protein